MKVLAIASAIEREGKTTLAANLARLAASTGQRTLLIEANLHAPGLARSCAEHPQATMTEVLAGAAPLAHATSATDVSGLTIWPAPAGGGRLDVDAMGRLFGDLKGCHDLILLDTPALMDFPEARRLVQHADAVLMVIDWGATAREDVAAALEAVGSAVPVAGALINRQPTGEPKLWLWLQEIRLVRQLLAQRTREPTAPSQS